MASGQYVSVVLLSQFSGDRGERGWAICEGKTEREDREEEKKREMKNYDKTTIAKEALLSVVFWIAGFIVVAIMNGSNLQQLIISWKMQQLRVRKW